MKKYTAGYASAPNASIHGDRYRQQVYEHSPAGITENEEMKILWDFTIQTDHEMNHRRPDITVHDNNNRVLIIRYLATTTLKAKREREKQEKYQDLSNCKSMCHCIFGDPGAESGGEGKSKRAEK